jgi:hypothetical protein
MKENLIFIKPIYDPRKSRIEKILDKVSPKFHDLNASIYGRSAVLKLGVAKLLKRIAKYLNFDFFDYVA